MFQKNTADNKLSCSHKMSKINRTESVQNNYKQRPIQNFPDYLKYVAKKSKAGFDKVHEELYRIYSEGFSTANKTIQRSYTDKYATITNNGTAKSKIGLRKRWSRSSLFWSSTGQETPTGHSFTSYIPEEKEDLGSTTSSKSEFDILSDEFDMIKHENQGLHNNGICSAGAYDKDKNLFEFDNIRFSMPHSELTDEAIYTNDRVLRVEHLTNISEKKEEDDDEAEDDPSELYSVPKHKYNPQTCHEIDDYVNLRAPCQPHQDIIDAKKAIEVESTKNMKASGTKEGFNRNTVNIRSKYESKVAKRPPLLTMATKTPVDNNDDEDNDYLPPSEWTQSCFATNGKCISDLYAKVLKKQISASENPSNPVMGNSNTEAGSELKEDNTEDSYYVPPSKWADPEYETLPGENEITHIYENIANQDVGLKIGRKDVEEEEADYDRPVEWVKVGDMCTEIDITNYPDTDSKDKRDINDYFGKHDCNKNMNIESAEDLYAKIVKDKTGNSSVGEYSVPKCNKLVTTECKDSNENSSEGDYSVPRWPIPGKVKSHSVPDIKEHIYSTPTSTISNPQNTEHVYANVKSKDETEFYNFTVGEVVQCLNNCSLTKLAEICEQEQLDGEHFRNLTEDDLKGEPYLMNWFYISKLFKVIGGWRPKMSFRR